VRNKSFDAHRRIGVGQVYGHTFIRDKGKCEWTESEKGFMSGLQTTSYSNDVLPLRSVPRTGCVGHCGNPRLKGGRKMSTGVSWLSFRTSFGRVMQLTANSKVLRLGDEEVSDAASRKERPQGPENLYKKNGDRMRIKDENWASDHKCNQYHKNLALTGVGHFRRPKNAMNVLKGRGCLTMSELSSTVGDWVGCGNFGANAESGISGPQCAVEPWNRCSRPQRLPNRLQQRRPPSRQE
jgi:hypothetical protein